MIRLARLSLVSLTCLAAFPALAQNATQAISATGKIIATLAWSAATPLVFGTFLAPSNSSSDATITIRSSDGNRTMAGGSDGKLVTDTNNSPAAGSATLASEGGYAIHLTVGSLVALDNSAGATLTLGTFTVTTTTGTGTVTNGDLSTGVDITPLPSTVVSFGATLAVPKGHATGTFTDGSFTVTASYN